MQSVKQVFQINVLVIIFVNVFKLRMAIISSYHNIRLEIILPFWIDFWHWWWNKILFYYIHVKYLSLDKRPISPAEYKMVYPTAVEYKMVYTTAVEYKMVYTTFVEYKIRTCDKGNSFFIAPLRYFWV